ncbi:MAG TPA: cysteine desulfurase family protein [Xanthobacteraceae bacterium]|nr:cysteine desulfurase family protein [Xanthobacteraceae bacterium]
MAVRTYLDWNASAPLRPQAREALEAALELSGNPSSVHGEGRAARNAIERAREQVAALAGADARNVIFTSGGTEANALALSPSVQTADDKRLFERLLVSAIEHPSVLAGGRFDPARVEQVPANAAGMIDLSALQRRLEALGGERVLVSLMAANNETGAVQPVREAADIVHRHGGLLHTDAVQAAGRIALDIAALGADLLTLSAHKIGGAKGAGALIKRSEDIHFADPLIRGGGQERGNRAGTENVAAIAAFGAAAAALTATSAADVAHMARLRDRLEAGLLAATPQAIIFGAGAARLPNTTLVALPGARAETLVIAFDLAGVAVSSGAACSSGKVAPSHVLAAMGVEPALARGAIRVSTGPATTEAEIDRFLNVWQTLNKSLSNGVKRGLAA